MSTITPPPAERIDLVIKRPGVVQTVRIDDPADVADLHALLDWLRHRRLVPQAAA